MGNLDTPILTDDFSDVDRLAVKKMKLGNAFAFGGQSQRDLFLFNGPSINA